MRQPFTIEQFRQSKCAHLNPHLFPDAPKKKSKYSSEKAVDDEGKIFDSKRELKRYKELKLMLKAGVIGFLARQVEFELNTGGSHSMVYKADFTYIETETGKQVVEDVKGFRTKEYLKKKKLMKKVLGIEIIEL